MSLTLIRPFETVQIGPNGGAERELSRALRHNPSVMWLGVVTQSIMS